MQHNNTGKNIVEREAQALMELVRDFPINFDACVDLLLGSQGRVAVSGIGKSGHIAKKIASTMASTGTPAFFIHPTEAMHGDLGMIGKNDVLIVLSNSGNTVELYGLLDYTTRNGIPVIAITSIADSQLARQADYTMVMPNTGEACLLGCAPTNSTTLMLALGDAMSMALLAARGFSEKDFNTLHPGGALGKRLRTVKDVMRTGSALPLVAPNMQMGEVLLEMSFKRLGCVGIMDNKRLSGIITDGDLRRHMSVNLLNRNASEIMTAEPLTIGEETPLTRSIAMMKTLKITVLFVVDAQKYPVGIIHLHDCLAEGMA